MTARILVVDDIEANRDLLETRLTAEYFNVITASDGQEALKICTETSVDLVLLDIMMPGIDGSSLIRKVRETHADLKVIFISGYAEDTFRKRVDDGGIVHFLPKPFSLKGLAAKVKDVMEG